jgi:hypothetical protein
MFGKNQFYLLLIFKRDILDNYRVHRPDLLQVDTLCHKQIFIPNLRLCFEQILPMLVCHTKDLMEHISDNNQLGQ